MDEHGRRQAALESTAWYAFARLGEALRELWWLAAGAQLERVAIRLLNGLARLIDAVNERLKNEGGPF